MIATTQSDCLFRMDVVPYTLLNYITGSVVKPIDQWYLTPYIYIYIYRITLEVSSATARKELW
jgi:hypothetical protein